MKVSVVVPIYNRVHLLSNCVRSIINQTHEDLELIVVDDGSENGQAIKMVIRGFDDPRVKYMRLDTRRGAAYARNEGYKVAKGDLIAVQDHDDMSLPDRLEKAVDYFENNDIDILYHGWYVHEFDNVHQCISRIYKRPEVLNHERILLSPYLPDLVIFKKGSKPKLREDLTKIFASMQWMQMIDWIYGGKKLGMLDIGLYEYIRFDDGAAAIAGNDGSRLEMFKAMQKIIKDEYGKDFKPVELRA